MGNRLTDKKVEEIYSTWLETKSVAKVATICNVSVNTVRAYRLKYDWPAKAEKVTKAVVKRVGDETVRRRARQQKQYADMAFKGSKALRMANPKKIKPRDAIAAIDIGIKGEREILGDSESTEVTIKLRLPKGMRIETLGQGE